MNIAWLAYGTLTERTGGTIYDARIVAGLGNVRVVSVTPDWAAVVRSVARADVVVGDELCHRELAEVFPRIRARRVLLVHHLMCWEPERRASMRRRARVAEAKSLRAADVVIATSHVTSARLRSEGYCGSVHVIEPGSDRLPRLERMPGEAFLFVGAVIPRKRVRELIEALPADKELRIVGSLERDRAYVASLPRRANVTFLDEVDEPTLARELSTAAALVMPSSLEGYGMAATEALAAGVPVIATNRLGFDAGDAVTYTQDLAATLRDFRARTVHVALPTWAEAVAQFRAALAR